MLCTRGEAQGRGWGHRAGSKVKLHKQWCNLQRGGKMRELHTSEWISSVHYLTYPYPGLLYTGLTYPGLTYPGLTYTDLMHPSLMYPGLTYPSLLSLLLEYGDSPWSHLAHTTHSSVCGLFWRPNVLCG